MMEENEWEMGRMRTEPARFLLPSGRECVLRNPTADDAEALLEYLRDTAAQTPFLLREPDEADLSPEQEERLLEHFLEAPRQMMLAALVSGKLAGNSSMAPVGNKRRVLHRCSLAIAIDQEYWGLGLGTALLEALLGQARRCGYEQAELEVIAGNERALRLYRRLGFELYGERPRAIRYGDGSYANELLMVKML